MPIILATVVLNGFLYVDQEYVLPRMIPKLTRKHDDIRKSASAVSREYQLQPMPAGDRSELLAAVYDPGTRAMENLDVVWRDADDQPTRHLRADAAAWVADTGRWTLSNGRVTTGLRPDQQTCRPSSRWPPTRASRPTRSPCTTTASRGLVELLSTRRLNELIAPPAQELRRRRSCTGSNGSCVRPSRT